jgi:hypothetical protein
MSVVGTTPFGRCQLPPAQSTRGEIVAAVSHDAEKGFIGINDPTLKNPDEDANDVGVDQAPDPRLPFLKIAIETGVLQRGRRL